MNDITSDLRPYQTDYLFLLIGTNPLPNYVAAQLLAKEQSKIYLLHTGGPKGTFLVADRLKKVLLEKKNTGLSVEPREIDETKSILIKRKMEEILNTIEQQASVGLHYTGGTKAMSVHVYSAVKKKLADAVFSYLDSRTLSLIIDGHKEFPVARSCKVSLAEIFALHGYEEPGLKHDLPSKKIPLLRSITEVHSEEESFKQWGDWLGKKDKKNRPPLEMLPDSLKYPSLKNVGEAFDSFCGGKATPDLFAQCLGYSSLNSCREWLEGKWLDEYVFWVITQIVEEYGISDYGFHIEFKKQGQRKGELDVAAVLGYQLYAISCIASDNKSGCKNHLFEAYVRARQLGGDEARVALVCCYNDPAALRNEIEETWFTEGRVVVFGRKDLPSLPDKLRNWFETANKSELE